MKMPLFAIVTAALFVLSSFAAVGGAGTDDHGTDSVSSSRGDLGPSNGWTHRPVVEHFTGLSCSPCMNGAHPDLSRLWEESGYTDEQPWNYIEWHEYNGGHEDALATEDTRARMRFYQPGVSGTPCADVDGGFVEAGGSHQQTSSCDYDYVKNALDESGNRDDNHMKMIDIEVHNTFDADARKFIINVTVTYVSDNDNGDPFHDPRLNGHLYVFMLEDNVTAWSKTLDEYALCHNVFREYAIEDETFSIIQTGLSQDFHAEWEIPDTMVADPDDDGNYEEIPIQVPINPLNVYPLAVVYDDDDRSSGTEDSNTDGDDGRGSPRALQSAIPKTTAYDRGNEKTEIDLPTPTMEGTDFVVLAQLSDDSGEPDNGYLVWRNTQDANNTEEHWQVIEMYRNGNRWEGAIPVNETSNITYGVMTFDSDGTGNMSGLRFYPTEVKDYGCGGDDDEFPLLYAGAGAVGFLVLAAFMLPGMTRKKRKTMPGDPRGASAYYDTTTPAAGREETAVADAVEDPVSEATYVPEGNDPGSPG